jgi:hypothetical protein
MELAANYIGYIYLPEEKEPTFCHLTYDHLNKPTITFLTEKRLFQSTIISIITGRIEEIGEITLINCHFIRYSTNFFIETY